MLPFSGHGAGCRKAAAKRGSILRSNVPQQRRSTEQTFVSGRHDVATAAGSFEARWLYVKRLTVSSRTSKHDVVTS